MHICFVLRKIIVSLECLKKLELPTIPTVQLIRFSDNGWWQIHGYCGPNLILNSILYCATGFIQRFQMLCFVLLGNLLQVSRLQSGKDVIQSVLDQAKGELRLAAAEYGLFWPEQKVTPQSCCVRTL